MLLAATIDTTITPVQPPRLARSQKLPPRLPLHSQPHQQPPAQRWPLPRLRRQLLALRPSCCCCCRCCLGAPPQLLPAAAAASRAHRCCLGRGPAGVTGHTRHLLSPCSCGASWQQQPPDCPQCCWHCLALLLLVQRKSWLLLPCCSCCIHQRPRSHCCHHSTAAAAAAGRSYLQQLMGLRWQLRMPRVCCLCCC